MYYNSQLDTNIVIRLDSRLFGARKLIFKDIELIARNQVNLNTGILERVEMLTVPKSPS